MRLLVLQRGATLALLAALVAGCGAQGDTRPVSGKVAFPDGSPLAGARVVFESSDKNVTAEGYTAADGSFKLSTYGDEDGAVPGRHRVIVMPPPSDSGMTGEGEGRLVSHPAPVLHPRYQSYDTSGLSFEVTDGPNQFDIVVQKP